MRNRHKYPANWEEISLSIRQRAGWSCQSCCKQCRKPKEPIQEFINRTGYDDLTVRKHPIRWCLTVAHLNHIEEDCRSENLMAMCAPCHLRYDAQHHAQSRKVNYRNQLEESGQLRLF